MSWIRHLDDKPFEIAEMIFGGILPIVLIIVGTIGNFLCVNYLLQRKHRQRRSAYIYLIFLCLTDTLSLYQWNMNYITVQFGDGKQLSDKSLFLCRSIEFLSFYTLHLSAIFLTFVVIDRILVFQSSYYRNNMTKRHQALIISILIFALLFILDGFLLSFGVVDENTKEVICYNSFNKKLTYFYNNIYPWIHLIIMYIVPFGIMIIGIILIIIKLRSHRRHVRHFNPTQRLSLMLVAMCVVYMVLTLPNRLCFSVFYSAILNHVYTDTILLASNNLLYTRNATNVFFLYASSVKFRKQLAKVCCYYCHRQRLNRVSPIEQTQMVIRSEQFQS